MPELSGFQALRMTVPRVFSVRARTALAPLVRRCAMSAPGIHPSAQFPSGGFLPTPLTYLQGAPVSFGEAIKQAFRNTFIYRGRASRSAYWWFFAFIGIVCVLSSIVVELVVSLAGTNGNNGANLAIEVILGIPILYAELAMLALFVRRLHDTNKSAWWILLAFVPYLGAITLLIFTLLKGTPGPNRYQA
jgi:uncharacterized membrane protein YhaH (DUF805 family)